jgi:hypothetical protein
MSFRDRSTPLLERGFSLIPLNPREKRPVVGLGANSRTQNPDLINAWALLYPDSNVGICSDDRVTILESDDAPRLRRILANMGVALPETLTGGSRADRPHWFYLRTPECGEDCLTVPGLFEFRNKNQYVAAPGSIHPDGHEYRFWNDAEMVPLPASAIDALRQLAAGYSGQARSEHIQPGPYTAFRNAYLANLNPADLLNLPGIEVSEGERHYTLMSLAGLLHNSERSAEEIAEILRDVQATYFDGGKADEEIRRISEYAIQQEPCEFEPAAMPSHALGLRVFDSAQSLEKWVAANMDNFSVDWELFDAKDLPDQAVLVHLNDSPLIRTETVSEVFAYRGLGKSMFVGSLIRILVKGGEFLGFTSTGGYRVLLVDGELPEKLLQSRLRALVGSRTSGLFRVRSLAQAPKSHMPALANPAVQDEFISNLKSWRPDIIIFDTRTAVFKHDTNDQAQLLAVNEFLIRLRAQGFAVVLTHHAGKNGTQRGRTDNDDITDLIIQLKQRPGWTPGSGLEFSLAFEKVRYGDHLEGFDAKWTKGAGWERLTDSDNVIVDALLKGGSVNKVAREFKVGNSKVADIKRKAEANGIEFPENKPGPKKSLTPDTDVVK